MTQEEFKNLKEGDIFTITYMVVKHTNDTKTSVITNRQYGNSDIYNPDHYTIWDGDSIYLKLGEKVPVEELDKAKEENEELKKRIAELEDVVKGHEKQIGEQNVMLDKADVAIDNLQTENTELLKKHEELSNDARTKMCLDWAIEMAKVLKGDTE